MAKKRIGWYLVVLGTLILFLLSIKPVSNILAYSLECKYKAPSKGDLLSLDAIVVLGGGVYPSGGLREYPEVSGVTYSRLVNGIAVFKQSKAKVLILSGGSPLGSNGESEAEVMKNLAVKMGVPEDKILIETKSHTTMEQAIEVAKILSLTKREQIGIVTSALHMLRADAAFRKKISKDDIISIPVNYIYSPPEYGLKSFIPSSDAFLISSCAIHEWFGIVWYLVRYGL